MENQDLQNYIYGNSTHVGRVRSANEDYYGTFETPNGSLFLVCDGMGGHVGGAKASQIAVESIKNVLFARTFPDAGEALRDAINIANSEILSYTDYHPELKGMGTTCVAVLVRGAEVYYAHVGDSRIYFLSDNGLHQITKDHSFVQMLVDAGEITEDEAETHPRKNEITNALGFSNMKPPTVSPVPLQPKVGDVILMCSDGLSGMISRDDIHEVLKSSLDPQEKSIKLIDMANEAGGKDNITVQVIEFLNSPLSQQGTAKNSKSLIPIIFIILLVCVILIGIAAFLF